ncbi:hypothetical protein EGI22_10985 [Lacihabitans sp. LS3-19]|uniref:hypothetical protein n=1 Tax=Lacihabitans sp. LS3-19 TaxID=2487335 RepID=UPI0020CBCFF7|nr:hypothetical protein [Lacihabitans sp. LS3-19]MCP9768439.1 hypothetical protein [Lacihabitans sp. LS3-19]
MKKQSFIKIGLALLTSMIILSFVKKDKILIEGTWTIAEVKTIRADGSSFSTIPHQSHVIFSKDNYSFCWTSDTTKLKDWFLGDTEKLQRFNLSIINTGTFELKDSILTTKAIFAMHPMFVNGEAKFKCTFIGDTLVLTGLSVFSEDKLSHPVYANGSYFINKLLKVKKQ